MIILNAHEADIGSQHVRRALPNHPVRMVGPFVFFDHMGPTQVGADQDVDVRPHPHVGLATVTWLFEGAILHRDSLGTEQAIHPGEVNWMTAGRGIVHSERRLPTMIGHTYRLEGLQVWVGLPQALAECEPSFVHVGADALPRLTVDGVKITVIAGTWLGERSPVPTASPLGYAAASMPAGSALVVPAEHAERAVYCVSGQLAVDGTPLQPGQMAVLTAGQAVTVLALTDARLMLPAGEPLDGPRFLSWNFVSHDRERLTRARDDWAAGRFARIPGDDQERIELPPPRGSAPA
jgi:redox-sensitive bicupin YhaK (pirin superfamily)